MQLREIKSIFHKELAAIYPKEEVDSFFFMMMAHYLGLERFALALQPNLNVTKEEEQYFFEGLAQLKKEYPIQYILGTSHFMDMDFEVNKNVLIPRPETEELVRWILQQVQGAGYKSESIKLDDIDEKRERGDLGAKNSGLRVLDIGTGSGCIAVAIAKNLPDAEVYALDISKEALEVAKKNAVNNGVEITFLQKDILAIDIILEKFDIIVSNPPYVRELEKKEIKKNVKGYEPDLALFVSDGDPLIFYKKITQFAVLNLSKNGLLFFEINQYLGKDTQQLLEDQNFSELSSEGICMATIAC